MLAANLITLNVTGIKHNATEVDGVCLVGATTIIVQNTML